MLRCLSNIFFFFPSFSVDEARRKMQVELEYIAIFLNVAFISSRMDSVWIDYYHHYSPPSLPISQLMRFLCASQRSIHSNFLLLLFLFSFNIFQH